MNRPTTASGSPQEKTPPDPRRARPRLLWLDFFRGLAVLVMIEAHVVNTFLASGLREGGWFPLLNYVNGLVAPSFLFIAGFAQGMERRISPGKPIDYRRRAGRLLGIAALGYALHFPFAELHQRRWADALRVGTQFDVLHCLAVSLGLLLFISWLVGKPQTAGQVPAFRGWLDRSGWWIGVVALAMIAVVGAPLVQGWLNGPVPLRALINQTTGSLFPLLPWAGFVLLGALAGAWPQRPIHERAAGMIGLVVLAWVCRGATFSAVGPAFFLERAVWVLVLAALCEWSARQPLPGLILFAGKHSLTLYAVHLVLITALVGGGVPAVAFDLPWTLAFLAAVTVGSLALAALRTRLPGWPGRFPLPGDGKTAVVPLKSQGGL